MRTIDQFMWGYQDHFRMSLEHAAEHALAAIGVDLSPVAMLVGFRATESSSRPPICVEPETGLVQPAHLAEVLVEGRARYALSNDAQTFHSYPELNAVLHAGYRDRHRADALAAALSASPSGEGRTFVVGYSQRIEEHEVHPVLSVDQEAFDALPRLARTTHTNMAMTVSLPDGVLQQLLKVASRCMAFREPPTTLTLLGEEPHGAAIRDAARSLIYSVATMSGNFLAHSLYDALGELVTMPYEGRAGAGGLCLVGSDHSMITRAVTLRSPVDVTSGRQFRKLLELTAPGLELLCDGSTIYGLGEVDDAYDGVTEDAFRVAVVARGTWELEHNGIGLLRVEHGKPVVPRARISEALFVDTVSRVFPAISEQDASRLWDVALIASRATHGTMLVISEAAEQEVARLAPQAVAIEPQLLQPEMFESLTGIDGSLMLAPDGTCHAVGVILDGYAAGVGDPGRGARYNSAVRYLRTTQVPCVIVIVSEDGMIDIHPELPRRVTSTEVEEAVRRFEAAVSSEPPNFESISKLRRQVERLSFYLNDDQVARSNLATEQAEETRSRISQMRIHLAPFHVNPRMDKSFFLD